MPNTPVKSLRKQLFEIPHNRFRKRDLASTALCILIFFSLLLPCIFSSPVVALELPYPDPISPKDGNTITTVTGIVFSWKPFYIGTNTYAFELSKSTEMLNPIIKSTISNGLTTYTYTGTLEYNTIYYWRVMSQDPLGDWSPVTPFKTPAPATTNNATGTKPQDATKTGQGSIIDYIEKNIGWPLFGGIIVVLAIAVVVLINMSKPKSPPGGQNQWQGPPPQWQGAPPGQPPPRPPNMQPPLICSFCGFPNSPDRKFCNSCGKGLFVAPPPPPPPPTLRRLPRFQPPPMGAFPQIITCPVCRTANPPTQQFCMRCGTSLMGGGTPAKLGLRHKRPIARHAARQLHPANSSAATAAQIWAGDLNNKITRYSSHIPVQCAVRKLIKASIPVPIAVHGWTGRLWDVKHKLSFCRIK